MGGVLITWCYFIYNSQSHHSRDYSWCNQQWYQWLPPPPPPHLIKPEEEEDGQWTEIIPFPLLSPSVARFLLFPFDSSSPYVIKPWLIIHPCWSLCLWTLLPASPFISTLTFHPSKCQLPILIDSFRNQIAHQYPKVIHFKCQFSRRNSQSGGPLWTFPTNIWYHR